MKVESGFPPARWFPPSVWVDRPEVTSELRKKVRTHRVVIVEGPRGVGKTAIVSASLDPAPKWNMPGALRDVRWCS